ncbi:hypothetical protein ACFPTO_17160 [Paraburkholderia denitrificans]|uniref:Transmembrane protein n=1 Tax=Paraburkholderia denitrificans TaxID=694025 RepID=A0ABW0JC92_9BURK
MLKAILEGSKILALVALLVGAVTFNYHPEGKRYQTCDENSGGLYCGLQHTWDTLRGLFG